MGLRERLQTVTQFLQKAATRGQRLREENERQAALVADRTRVLRRRGVMVALVAAAILLGLLLLPIP